MGIDQQWRAQIVLCLGMPAEVDLADAVELPARMAGRRAELLADVLAYLLSLKGL